MHKFGLIGLAVVMAMQMQTSAFAAEVDAASEGEDSRQESAVSVRENTKRRPAEPLRATPEKQVSADRVFHRPAVIDHRAQQKKKEEQIAKETFKHPSLSFLSFLSPYAVGVHDVTLLQDDVASLFRKHPECRRIESFSDKGSVTGKVACSKPELFQAEGGEVIFGYAKTNELLTGVTLSFSSAMRAKSVAQQIIKTIEKTQPTFTQHFSPVLQNTDSPMLSVSLQQGLRGYLVSVDSHHVERFKDSEVYAATKQQEIEFGQLTLGKTTFDQLPSLPKTCTEVSLDSNDLVREFYGVCFGFPYESHIQLEFDSITNLLRSVVLSPIGAATGSVLEEAVKSEFGLSTYCRRISSTVSAGSIKTQKPRSSKQRVTRMNSRPAWVFAGTCETPIVYTTQMRFVFENRNLNHTEIGATFERRRQKVNQEQSMQKAFETRKDSLEGFFE